MYTGRGEGRGAGGAPLSHPLPRDIFLNPCHTLFHPKSMRLQTLSEIRVTSPLPWRQFPLLKPGRITMLASEPGAGKSTLMLHSALTISGGLPFLGAPPSRWRFPTIFLGLDAPPDDYGYLAHRLAPPDLHPRHLRFCFERTRIADLAKALPSIITEAEPNTWNENWEDDYEVAPLQVLMIDAFRQVHPYDENDSREMAQVMDCMRVIADSGVAIVFSHHVGKMAGDYSAIYGARGSSVIAASADICFHLSSSKQHNQSKVVTLTPTKGRSPDMPDAIHYTHSWAGDRVTLAPVAAAGAGVMPPPGVVRNLSDLSGAYSWSTLLSLTKLSTPALKAALATEGWRKVGAAWQKV